jgi:hypothetical protein
MHGTKCHQRASDRHAEVTPVDVTDALYGGAFLPASMISKGNFSWITNPAPTRFRDFDY